MPNNALRVQKQPDGSFAATVWGPNGASHDLTPNFQEITGPKAPSLFTHRISLKDSTFATDIDFKSGEYDLRYNLEPEVARQLVAITQGGE